MYCFRLGYNAHRWVRVLSLGHDANVCIETGRTRFVLSFVHLIHCTPAEGELSIGFAGLACGVHIWHKQVPVIQANLEDLIIVNI